MLLVAGFALPAFADVQYIYDEAGRLVEIINPSGTSAQYTYDAAGNVTAIKQVAATAVSIAEFTPNAGPVGTTVTIYGSGYSATPSLNTVKFNGTAATVTSATATQLVVTVSSGATTGKIAVTVGSNTATSAQNFTVAATTAAASITGFTPNSGATGTSVTINGTNFDTNPSNDKVRFTGVSTSVSSATPTQVVTVAPSGTGSGRITLGTPNGSAVSSSDFFIPPTGYTTADVGATGRANVGGAPASFSQPTGKIGLILFDGVKGQNLGIGVGNVTFNPSNAYGTIYVKQPNGRDLIAPVQFDLNGTSVNLHTLSVSGTYTLLVVPGSALPSINFTATISPDITGALTINGPGTTFSTSRPGQNGRYTFSAAAGQNVSVLWANATIPSSVSFVYSTVKILDPNGAPLAGTGYFTNTYNPSGTLDARNLAMSGTYALFVDPSLANTGSVDLQVLTDVVSSLSIDGPDVPMSLAAGQNGTITFSGTVGDQLGLGLSQLVLTPTGINRAYPVSAQAYYL